MSSLRIILTVIVFIVSSCLFRAAAGSLKPTKLNLISTIYYFIVFFNLIGASLVYIGLRKHYLIQKIRLIETIDSTYYYLVYCVIMFPATLLLMKVVMNKVVRNKSIIRFIDSDIQCSSNNLGLQQYVLILIVICTAATFYVFKNLGYIPIVSIVKGGDLNALRQSGNRFFPGNQYIKNLLMSCLTPFLSYFIYIYYRITKSKTWKYMFFYMAMLSVIVLTYDFSKSPIITYILGIYLLEVAMGNVKNSKRFHKLIFFSALIILLFYVVMMGAADSLRSIYTGPVGRIIFTQIATFFLHVDAFPVFHSFLNGASFNGWMSIFLPEAAGLRSGRVVMEIYNAQGIASNTAGVMNTVFPGEAYANFGVLGVIIAPIIFGIVIGFVAYLLPGLKKTPVTILLYVQMTLQYAAMVEGGYVDIFYSAAIVFYLIITISFAFVSYKNDYTYYSGFHLYKD